MSATSRKAKELFVAALKLAPEQWDGYLAGTCGGDEEMRGRVMDLLQANAAAGSFLESPPQAEGATIPQAVTERPGTVIGPYKLLQQIGEGGMGIVFMAEQARPVQRKVALKVIKPGMDSRQVIARFEAERQALAMMDHVNIARVFDGGTTGGEPGSAGSGRPYFVMELIHGLPITRYCDDNRLTPRERLELFVPVCQAIQHAHQKGIIHRDLKPSNVMITLYDGKPVPKVIDFGVAKATEQKLTERTLFTQYGTMVGTLEYMSPEQAEMSALGVDTRSDIYSLGVLLYELLTSSTPLTHKRMKEAAYAEILRLLKEEEPPRPSTRLSDSVKELASISAQRKTEPAKLSKLMRGELDWIVMKALEKDRNRRYETASAFAADVERYLKDEQVQACPPSVGYRMRKFLRRYKRPVLAAAVVMLALLAGIIGTTLGLIRATAAEVDAVNEAGQKETALLAARQSEQDATDRLFQALLNQARSGRFSRQMGQRLESLAALGKAALIRPDERLRDEAIAAMALPDIRRGPIVHTAPASLGGVTFDGPYQSYSRIENQGIIGIHSIPDNAKIGSVQTKIKSKAQLTWMSPNGRVVAVLDDRLAVQLWRIADNKALLRQEVGPCFTVAFSPDSRQLAIATGDWILCIDTASGEETTRWRLPTSAYRLAFHPKNGWLAVGYSRSAVASIFDSATGNRVADLPVGWRDFSVVAWHPDGARLAVAGGDHLAVAGSDPHCIQIWDVATRRKLATLQGHVQRVNGLSFHPDGSLLASTSGEGVMRLWDPATGRQLMQLPLAAVANFSSTGQWLGYAVLGDEHLQLLEVTPSLEYRTIASQLYAVGWKFNDIGFNGRLLAMGSGDLLLDLSSRRELASLPWASHWVHFQSDGSELLTCGDAGLYRWSIQENKEAANELRLGPPRKVALPFVPHRAALSRDGRTLAIVSEAAGAGLLLNLVTESVKGQPFAHPSATEVALSQDGRWIASCGWHSDCVRLWNASTGAKVHEWVLGKENGVFFTPDSRALIICRGDAFTFWDVETRQPMRRLARDVAIFPGYVAFSADGKMMAMEMAPAVIHLKEVATGRTLAKLEDPHGDRAGWTGFSPDGTQLVVAAPYAKAVHVWDLRAIRERLKGMELDWDDWPEFPLVNPQTQVAEVAKVEVLLGEPGLTPEQKARQAIAQHRRVLNADPDNPRVCNDLAWLYLTAPVALRDVKAALPLAENAVRLTGGDAHYRNTLGVAYYRAGRYREAVEVLRANLDKQDDKALAFDLYFLAMSHHHLGEAARARDYYDWAVRWTWAQPGLSAAHLEELTAFRTEAKELLGIDKK